MFFLDFLWWSDCYVFNSWYVFLILTDILRNKLFEYLFYLYFLPTLMCFSPLFWIPNFFSGGGTPTLPLKTLKNVPVVMLIIFRNKTIVNYPISLVHERYLFTNCGKKAPVNQLKTKVVRNSCFHHSQSA